jgi:hypothetical protein
VDSEMRWERLLKVAIVWTSQTRATFSRQLTVLDCPPRTTKSEC